MNQKRNHGGPPRRGDPSKKGPDEPADGIRRVGGATNEHGTRSIRRVRCSRCGKVDHVAGRPRDAATAMCRACAEEELGIYEEGAQAPEEKVDLSCAQCGAAFALSARVLEKVKQRREREAQRPVLDEDAPPPGPLCPDCLRGFTPWQGSIDNKVESPADLGEERRPGVRLRAAKKKP